MGENLFSFQKLFQHVIIKYLSMPKPTDNFVELTSTFAVATGAIGADLMQIPNAPIVFKKDPSQKQRNEDAIIAWYYKTSICY